jgi:hypothetical protein
MIKTSEVKALAGAETGKAALLIDLPGPGEVGTPSGIVLTPTPGVWSLFPWRLEAMEVCQNYQLSTRLYEGFVVFGDVGADPLARFGTGIGDPGYSSNSSGYSLPGIAYSLNSIGQVDLVQNNLGNRPIEISIAGEITLWYVNNSGNPGYVKAVLTVGAELVLPVAPVLVP